MTEGRRLLRAHRMGLAFRRRRPHGLLRQLHRGVSCWALMRESTHEALRSYAKRRLECAAP